jgi:tRNA threonylcarbamoyladenosine biosynthesis protein TsaE
MQVISHCVEETEALAARLAPLLGAGAVLALWGGLGAGKTAFVRGLARGLGVQGRVSSPTFTLMHEHRGRLPLYHFDLYRLEHGGLEDLGADDWFYGGGVCAVEWPGYAGALLPEARLDITLEHEGDLRRITLEAQGEQYQRIIEELNK